MFVTDTHTIVWYSTGKVSNLSTKVLQAFEKADNGESVIYIPTVVLWETAILQKLGKVNLREKFDYWADKLLQKQGFEIIHMTTSIIANSVGYNFNNDIFDKVIVASAVEFELPLMTKDNAIIESNLTEIYW
jgi:PIN domain nuclease of toxin-antitoxin system